MPEKEVIFIKQVENYTRAIQERVATFFITIGYGNVLDKVIRATDAWYNIIVNESETFRKILYIKGFKNKDKNFIKRKGYRTKTEFGFDLISSWVVEQAIYPYLHEYMPLKCEPFYVNNENCDSDCRFGWDKKHSRSLNSKSDFLTKVDGVEHNIELKSMFTGGKKSANFKTFFTPDDELYKNHVLFFNFNGMGNPKGVSPHKSHFELYYIPWKGLTQCHVHYPPQLDSKPCFLVHLQGEGVCEQYNINGVTSIGDIKNDNNCFIIKDRILSKILTYDEVGPYVNNDKTDPRGILSIIKEKA